MKTIVTLVLAAAIGCPAFAGDTGVPAYPRVEFTTTHGKFTVELDGRRAPISVRNFLQYVNDGYYAGTIFHRVIPGFVAQAGGFDTELNEKKTRETIANESGNGLTNVRGTIAMARTADPHTATAQFYINLGDNRTLDPKPSRWGYCVFGQVVEGIETLDAIAAVPTGRSGPFARDFPQSMVTIESAVLLDDQSAATPQDTAADPR